MRSGASGHAGAEVSLRRTGNNKDVRGTVSLKPAIATLRRYQLVMRRAYKIAKGGRVLACVAGPLMLVAFVAGLLLALMPDEHGRRHMGQFYVCAPICLPLMVIVAVAAYNTIWGRIIVDEEKISSTGIPRRTFYIHQIRGFTIDPRDIINVVPNAPVRGRIKISAYTERLYEIQAWVRKHCPDLDKVHAQAQQSEALGDARIGETEEQRIQKLRQQRMLTSILNWTGAFAAVWLLIKPVPYPAAVLVCCVIPLLVIAASKRFHGRMTPTTEGGKHIFPDASAALGLPAGALALRALIDYHIYSFRQLWFPVLLLAAILLIVTTQGAKPATINARRQTKIIVSLCFIYLFYSLGLLTIANCYLDHSQAQIFIATVLDKRIQKDAHSKDYLLHLSPWGPQKESVEVGVRRPIYEAVGVGQALRVTFKNGRLGVPWFVLQTQENSADSFARRPTGDSGKLQ